jgi:arginase family enzyme
MTVLRSRYGIRGFSWDKGSSLLHQIFNRKQIIGFDVVELSYNEHDDNSPFAAAKLIYKMLGFRLLKFISDRSLPWPSFPQGPIFP